MVEKGAIMTCRKYEIEKRFDNIMSKLTLAATPASMIDNIKREVIALQVEFETGCSECLPKPDACPECGHKL